MKQIKYLMQKCQVQQDVDPQDQFDESGLVYDFETVVSRFTMRHTKNTTINVSVLGYFCKNTTL